VDLARGFVDTRGIRPILQDVILSFSEEGLEISATNLDLGIRALIRDKVEVDEPGSVALPATEVAAILRQAPDEILEFEADDGGCRIRGADSRFRINGDDPDEFPGIEALPETEPVEVEAEVLAEMIRKTRFAATPEPTRYALNGVLFVAKAGEKNIEMVGADGRRLANIRRKAKNDVSSDVWAILSLPSASMMERIVADAEGSVRLYVQENKVWLAAGDVLMKSQVVEGHYPNYAEVIPDDCDKKAVLARGGLLSALRRAAVVLTDESHAVDIEFQPNALLVKAETPERGSGVVELEAQYGGEPTTLRFNPDFLLDMLKVVEEEDVVVEFKEATRPALMRSGRNYLYLVMPITEV